MSRRPPRFEDEPHSRARGRAAEEAAARWLRRQGYEILDRNVTTPGGEIDLVAKDAGTLCFIEIKARRGSRYGPAVAAVDRRKQRRLARAAAFYLAALAAEGPCRFDVLGLDRVEAGWRFTLVKDAFSLAPGP